MLAGLALAAACSAGDPTSSSSPGSPAGGVESSEIHISPKSVVLEPAQALTFQAFARTSSGDNLVTALEWTATGGTMQSDGSFRAPSAGTYRVVGKKRGNPHNSDTSVVVVTPTPPTLTSIVISPASASVAVQGQVQFSALGRLSDGTSTAVAVVWNATGGTIDAGGLFTAGTATGTFQVIAKSASLNVADTAAVTVTAAPVTAPTLRAVVITPDSASVPTGRAQQFTAQGLMSDGTTAPLSSVTYAATGGTISSSGLFQAGQTAGSFQVTATSGGLTGTAAVTVTASTPTVHSGRFVAPSGSASNDGSASRPWDLATALGGGHGVAPGDTIWLRGGTYRGEFTNWLNGQAGNNIVIRHYPGERATIDGNLVVMGSYVTFWGFEIMNSNPVGTSKMGVNVRAPGTKLINLVVHDAGMSGLGVWVEAPGAEVYGSIVYNNGTHNNLDHGIYLQNTSGTKRIADNIVFDNFAYGIHGYSATGQGDLLNITLDGNASFNNGTINAVQTADLFVGGQTSVQNLTVTRNMVYKTTSDIAFWLGYNYGGTNSGLMMTDNYIAGQFRMDFWRNTTAQRNTILRSSQEVVLALPAGDTSPNGYSWAGNAYQTSASATPFSYQGSSVSFSSWKSATRLDATSTFSATAPTGVKVFVRPNQYEPGRANVIVYNWDRVASVGVDLSGVLVPGDRYEVRHVFDIYGTPVASGSFAGGVVQLPLSSVRPPTPIGRGTTPAAIGPQFAAFVVQRVS